MNAISRRRRSWFVQAEAGYGGRPMSDAKRDVTKRSDRLLEQVRELGELEIEKRSEPISSPRFHELARQVSAKAREIRGDASDQERVGNETERGSETIQDLDEREASG
jgi:hypothetical protein